ncbi:hypothetical protein GF407_17110 [candidate division KSB1 bacterium]|nr:hypothetical protein [candidate division KSB1 bacterium]
MMPPPVGALTYNLRLGTSSGANDVFTALTRAKGQRFVPDAGNRGSCRTLIFYRTPVIIGPCNASIRVWLRPRLLLNNHSSPHRRIWPKHACNRCQDE